MAAHEDGWLAQARARVGTPINDKWTIDALLGAGGMATVFAATHRNGSRAALKVLHPELARDDSVRERFLREGRIANRIDHPSVVQITDDDTSDLGEVFLVMELLEGETLEAFIRREGGKLELDQSLRIFDPVLDLLGKAHELGIIHRDIKPENIFITSSGAVKVLDFGIARFREQRGGVEATRQGTALGTPSFMAPEQALGLGDIVDGRADLFSVGACLYLMLSGTRLLEGRAENEAFVLAATQAAPSIATVAEDLPVEIVSFVDKALAYERNNRFADASTMRTELRGLLAAAQAGRLTTSKRAAGLVVRGDDLTEDDSHTSAEDKAQLVKRMQNIWKLLGMFVSSTRQYGWNHPESGRHLEAAFQETLEALTLAPEGVRWDITPYAFVYEGTPIWEPERAPFDRMPFQLFGDGLRKVQLRPGIVEQELRDLVAVLMKDPASGGPSEDDAITGLWDRHFEHVAYLAIDSFAEGDAEDRDAFEKECDEIANQALEFAELDSIFEHESLEARAQEMNLASAMEGAAESAAALAMDQNTRAALGAQLAQSTEQWTERYVECFARGYLDALSSDGVEPIAAGLREWTRDQITLFNYPLAFGMFGAIADTMKLIEPDAGSSYEKQIASAMFPPSSLGAIITKLTEDRHGKGGDSEPLDSKLVRGLERVLLLSEDGSLVPLICDRLEASHGTILGRILSGYLKTWASGNEEELGARLHSARAEIALELIGVLAELDSEGAVDALATGFQSSEAEVRLEALKSFPERGAPKLSESLGFLLKDPEGPIREEALRLVARFNLRAVGPEIVRFIASPEFHTRSIDERSLWLETLASLNPARAESLAIEILTTWKFIPRAEHEQTRIAAAEALARFGSRHALEPIQTTTRKRWWNTPPVREASERALQAISERNAEALAERSSISMERD